MPRATRPLAARRLVRAALVASLAGAAAAAPAAAQQASPVSLTFGGAATSASFRGYSVGPLNGQVALPARAGMPGQMQAVTFFCVDFLHNVTPGQTFTANVSAISTSPGALQLTRQPNGLEGYRKAVWLADQFARQAPEHWGGIQSAIWKLFGSGSLDGNPVKSGGVAVRNDPRNEAYWTDRAGAFRVSSVYDTYDYSQYAIYTDVDRTRADSRQEFIGRQVVPEPATFALAGAGLLALGGAGLLTPRARARRARGAAVRG